MSLPWWWCDGGGDLGPWHGGPVPDLLLACKALLMGRLQVQGPACSTGRGCKHPVSVQRVQLRLTSNRLICLLLLHVGHNIQPVHTQVLGQRCRVLMDLLPIQYPQAYGWVHNAPWPYLLILQDVVSRRVSSLTPRILVVGWKLKRLVLMYTSNSCFASLLFKWKTVETVLSSLSFSHHCLRYRAKVLMSYLRVPLIFCHFQ